MAIKFTRTKGNLLHFVVDEKQYYFETVKGYSFKAKTKCGNTINMLVYKLNDKWHVNDNEGYYSQLISGHNTRKKAVELACNIIKKHDRDKINETFKDVERTMKERLKGRTEIANPKKVTTM